MLAKRIIPCLDIKDGRTVKGVRFKNLAEAGDPVLLGQRYAAEGADELVFLDITATVENRPAVAGLVSKIAAGINIPFTVGGGITGREDVGMLLEAGADKVTINTAALRNPRLISSLADSFGSQCIVVAVDARKVEGRWMVFSHAGRRATGREAVEWAADAEQRGAGEILATSMDHDGTRKGYAAGLTKKLADSLSIPVIASGGAGRIEHFAEIFTSGEADAALAAGIFHYGDVEIGRLKKYLQREGIEVRL